MTIRIESGTCGVWLADARLAGTAHEALLTAADVTRANKYRRAADRRRAVAAWALTRTLLAGVLGCEPALVPVRRKCARCESTEHGKPELVGDGPEFSLSHSGDYVAVAVSDGGPVGVDVEQVKVGTDYSRLWGTLCAPAELASTAQPATGDVLRIWARKEAMTKAVGTGLATPFTSFAVTGPQAPAALLSWPGEPERPRHTTIVDLHTDAECAAAVAVLRGDVSVVQHDGSPLLAAVPRPRRAENWADECT